MAVLARYAWIGKLRQTLWPLSVLPKGGANVQHSARRVALFSGKGGVGKTFISLHLAQVLAERGKRTLLLDLDMQSAGAMATMLKINLTYDFTYTSMVGVHHIVHPIQQNLDFVSSPTRLDRAIRAQKRDVTAKIGKLQEGYDWVVIDLANRFDMATVSALSVAHWVWFVTTPDPLAKAQTTVAINRLESLGLERNVMRVVANRLSKGVKVPSVGLNTYSIPYDETVSAGGGEKWGVSDVCLKRLRWIVQDLHTRDASEAPTRASAAVARAGIQAATQIAR